MKSFNSGKLFVILALCAIVRSSAQIRTVEDRVDSLLGQMTFDEKFAQLHQNGGFTTPDNPRLNIPGFIMADGPHGVRDGKATSFPVGIGMAAMWDVELAGRIGVAMGKEFRGKGKNQALGPCLDLDRDPRNGRSPETGGEDPYLDAQTTSAVVKGIQSTPTIATVKHFNINHRENGRTSNNIIASMRMLMETNGLTFRTAVQEGGAMCVMNAYNLINGEKCAENTTLLTTILRDRWGFPFYVVSDWGSIWDTKKAITAGCDVEMGSDLYRPNLPGLVANGQVSQSTIDLAVRRVLRTKIVAGMLDHMPEGDPGDVNNPDHQDLCREAARKSIVLLKNKDHILPLSKDSIGSIALIGPSAAVAQIDGGGSAYVTPYYAVTPRQGIEAKIGAAAVKYVKGCDINSADTSGFAAARTAAASSDVVIFVGGLDPSQESEGMDRVGGSIDLPFGQKNLINSLAAVNDNLIVVIYSGGICGMYNVMEGIKGFLYAFYPGQEAGTALADILFGDVNPSGKLPVTMPLVGGLLPPWDDNINDALGGGYRWFDAKGYPVQFAFGHGLSYTTFSYSDLVIDPVNAPYGSPVVVSAQVTNTGGRAGEEVVQLYLSQGSASVPMPVKELKGFRRVSLQPGETKTVLFTLTNDEMYYWNDADSSYQVEPGIKTVRVGGASDSLPLSGTFTIASGEKKPDFKITNVRTVPPYPVKGEPVTFIAWVKNEGTGPTPEGSPISVLFSVDGVVAANASYSSSIPAGGMALIEANGGPVGTNLWTPASVGSYTIVADADPENTMNECVEDNNSAVSVVSVSSAPLANVALNKPVEVSSVENADLGGSNAVDGNMTTRWSSAFSDPQWLTIDLGSVIPVAEVMIYWEAAFARSYQVQLSNDNADFWTVYTQLNGDGGFDKVTMNEQARYIRIYCLQRGTQYGNSIYEIVIHSDRSTAVGEEDGSTLPDRYELFQNYPNPFNPSTTIAYQLPERQFVTVTVYDLLGKEVAEPVRGWQGSGRHSVTFNADHLSSGIYYYTIRAGSFTRSKKFVLVK